jgi:phosphomannomutase
VVMFGHDGWYGQLARHVTFDSVGEIARAAGLMLVREYLEDARLVVGYDRRFLADAFAREIARDLASLGIEICLIPRPVPLPALSMTIRHVDAVGGIMVTGGSQPADISGIVLRGWDGGALPRWILNEIESSVSISSTPHRIGPTASVIAFDPIDAYLEAVGRIVPLRAIKQSGITLAIDSLWGTGAELVPRLTDGEGSRSVEIRTAHNPLFPELTCPHPTPDNLARLRRIVRSGDAALGVGISADGCALGLLDERGVPVSAGDLLSLIANYLLTARRRTGSIARTIASSSGVDRIVRPDGRLIHETPVGHTAVCEALREQSPLLHGDEFGGIIVPEHLLERDAVKAAMFVVSALVRTGMELSEMVEDIRADIGPRVIERTEVALTDVQRDLVQVRMTRDEWPDWIDEQRVVDMYMSDGIKFEFGDDTWLLIRYDEFDDSLHIVAEASNSEQARDLIQAGRSLILG